jgi:cytochrome c553
MPSLHGVGGRVVVVESEHLLRHRIATWVRTIRILLAMWLVAALAAPAYAQAPNPAHTSGDSTTCATCHPDVSAAFEMSAHYRQWRRGDARAPTCVTCHGTAAARLSLLNGEANPCATCHGPGNVAPRSEYVTHVRGSGLTLRKT